MIVIDNGTAKVAVDPIDRFAEAVTRGQYGVYQLFDLTGRLLYVGRTSNLAARLAQHAGTQPWWEQVSFGQWTPVDDYAEAVALERASIEADQSLFNYASTVGLRGGLVRVPDDVASELRRLYADTADSDRLNTYMRALHDAGWTLASIGIAIGITRERVRQRVALGATDSSVTVPAYVKPGRTPQRKVWASLSSDEASRMSELHALATKVRGKHGADHPYRQAGEALTEAIVEAKMRGVRNREIAAAVGVTVSAVTMRLKSRGFLTTAPSMPGYGSRGALTGESTRKTHCVHGHEMSGENLRLINGDEARRACRACDREAVRRYQARKKAAAS